MTRIGKSIQIPEVVEQFYRNAGRGMRRLLVLTYEFNSKAFESQFNHILQMGVKVDVVAGKPVGEHSRKIHLWRARWRGTFHPKMIVLLGNSKVAVGIGSANMTASGLSENLEIWEQFEGGRAEGVLLGARRVLETLDHNGLVPGLDLSEYISALPRGKGGALLLTTDGPLITQVLSRLSDAGNGVREIHIVSPLYADGSPVITQLRRSLGPKRVLLYTEPGTKGVPPISGVARFYVLEARKDDEDSPGDDDAPDLTEPAYATLHAKMYAFLTRDKVHLFWGSANLSASAWLRGKRVFNFETMVHSQLSIKSWIGFIHKSIPGNCVWKEVDPNPTVKMEKEEEWTDQPSLLHATWDGETLTLICSHEGKHTFRIRVPGMGRALRCSFQFQKGQAPLSRSDSGRLGISSMPPAALEWRAHSNMPWGLLPVNDLTFKVLGEAQPLLVDSLYVEYAGRNFYDPIQTPGTSFSYEEEETFKPVEEEYDLANSSHQGDLDQIVLKWRAVLQRVKKASGPNRELLKARGNTILNELNNEARYRPTFWLPARLCFIKTMVRNACLA